MNPPGMFPFVCLGQWSGVCTKEFTPQACLINNHNSKATHEAVTLTFAATAVTLPLLQQGLSFHKAGETY
jgi:hypothetical protein